MFHNYEVSIQNSAHRPHGGFRTVDTERDAEVIFWTSLARDYDRTDIYVCELRWGSWRIPFDRLREPKVDPETDIYTEFLSFERFGTTKNHGALKVNGRRPLPPGKQVPDAVFSSPEQEHQARILAIEGTLMRRTGAAYFFPAHRETPIIFIDNETRYYLSDFGTPTESDLRRGKGQVM